MDKNNPAVFECPESKNKLHSWRRVDDGSAVCTYCKLKLTQEQADDVWRE